MGLLACCLLDAAAGYAGPSGEFKFGLHCMLGVNGHL